MIITTKGNNKKESARGSDLGDSQTIGFPRFKGYPFAEVISNQEGGRGPMASEESQLHMLSTSDMSPVKQD